jgi:hypothetical protein
MTIQLPKRSGYLEIGFSEVCAFFLLSDNGNRAVSVPNHGLRYAAHKRPP